MKVKAMYGAGNVSLGCLDNASFRVFTSVGHVHKMQVSLAEAQPDMQTESILLAEVETSVAKDLIPSQSLPIAADPHSHDPLQGTFREHSGNVQGTSRERSGNVQGTLRERSGNIQGTFKERSGNIHSSGDDAVVDSDDEVKLSALSRVTDLPKGGDSLAGGGDSRAGEATTSLLDEGRRILLNLFVRVTEPLYNPKSPKEVLSNHLNISQLIITQRV
jgi:hypothetical protein